MNKKAFRRNAIAKLQRGGFSVTTENVPSGIDLLSTNPKGTITAGVLLKPHGHLTAPIRRELLTLDIPIYVASEKYTADLRKHEVKFVRLREKEGDYIKTNRAGDSSLVSTSS